MAFSINSVVPPAYAAPSAPSSPGVVYPVSSGFDGEGRPIGAVGQVEALVGRGVISAAGHTWWMNHFGASYTALSVTVTNLNVYDALKEAETTYSSAVMHRPTWGESNSGVWYKDYRIRFTNLTV